MKKKYLIVAAHPDDETLGCGGLIYSLREKNHPIKVVFIGEGSSCRFDKKAKKKDIEKEIEKRQKHCLAALKVLKVKNYSFYNLPCGKFDQIPIIEIGKIIENEIKNFKPNVIITHSPNDVHIDHKTCFQATLQATRPGSKNENIDTVMSFEIPSSSDKSYEKPFKPNFFVEIKDKSLKKKLKALQCYKTEVSKHPFSRSGQLIKSLAIVRGAQCGKYYAEAFSLIRNIDKVK